MYKFWGKSNTHKTDDRNYHLLVYHSLDVAAVGKKLLELDAEFKKKFTKLSRLQEEQVVSLLLFFISLHDIGKFSIRFQNHEPDILWKLQGIRSNIDTRPRHDILGFHLWDRLLANHVIEHRLLPIESGDILDWRDLFDPWAKAVLGHHGKPPNAEDFPLDNYFYINDQEKSIEFTNEISKLFFSSIKSDNYLKLEPYEVRLKAFKRLGWLLAGLCTLCDWIGSDERFFPFNDSPKPLERYWEFEAQTHADVALKESGVLIPPSSKNKTFSFLFPHIKGSPSPLQSHAGRFNVRVEPQLHIFEDLTGSGKTEAALYAAHRMLSAGLGEGVFVALPTMATANSMYERLKGTYRYLFEGDFRPSLLLSHSAKHLSKTFRNSLGLEKIKSSMDGEEPSSAYCALWLADNKKKSLLAAVGIGTIDQALLGILPSRHQSLRLFGLCRNILIVDEVHAYDPYMHTLLCRLLKFHAAQSGSAILLSATLPEQTKFELINAFHEGLGNGDLSINDEQYPLATIAVKESIDEHPIKHRAGTERQVEVQFIHEIDKVLSSIRNAVSLGGCVCWVRNTVMDAHDAYHLLSESIDKNMLTLFHARFALVDRLNIEGKVMRTFGKESREEERKGRVVIGTQVVEQSLDLDFDLMITDLAPIELIFQRAGRCQRHQRKRPDRFLKTTIIVFSPDPQKKITSAWYSSLLPRASMIYPFHGRLWLTANLLKEKGKYILPQDARVLIESVYSGKNDDLIPDVLKKIDERAYGKSIAEGSLGNINALELDDGYSATWSNWLDDTLTPTRLGEPNITVRLAKWKDGKLYPWTDKDDAQQAWLLSELNVREKMIKKPVISDLDLQTAVEDCVAKMKDKGKWSVLLPLNYDDGGWSGTAYDGYNRIMKIDYHPETGFVVDRL